MKNQGMEQNQALRGQIPEISLTLESLISKARKATGLPNGSLAEWENTCRELQTRLSDDSVRVAVVGAIKSGKSTFVNSLFKGDYLMRGAGVVTSIVTRIRRGATLYASLYFKSWERINAEIDEAMVMLPSVNADEDGGFDLRKQRNRIKLEKALAGLESEQWVTDSACNINSLLLSSYLKGYEEAKAFVGNQTEVRRFFENRFGEHRKFVSNDALAVYLADIELEIDSEDLAPHVEIADCQGSDSPNPLHLTAIQDYLVRTHLIVYVISSRTGLRQADLKFLSMIKKMGMLENMLFVVNCDFSEHDSAEDLSRLVDRVREELSLIRPEPELYAFSALFNLFKSRRDALPQRDCQRLDQWRKEEELVDFSDRNTESFRAAFDSRVISGRSSLLLRGHLERLNVVASGLRDWLRVNNELFSRDADSAHAIIEKIKQHRARIDGIKSMINSTLDGTVHKVKLELKPEIDQFFDLRNGSIGGDIVERIRSFEVLLSDYKAALENAGFSKTLYLVFQQFKQTMDAFMAETVNPEVIRFVRSKEEWVRRYLESIVTPYDAIASEALNAYRDSMGGFGISIGSNPARPIAIPSMESVKASSALSLPPASAMMHYSARVRTEAAVRLGLYSIAKLFRKIRKKKSRNPKEEEMSALKDGIRRMKRDAERSVVSHLKDYRENLKFQYLFKLIDAGASSIDRMLSDRFRACGLDLSDMMEQIGRRREDRHQISETLGNLAADAHSIHDRVQAIRENF
jgi:GTPase SAR1 family protein